mmetsp:Transcript_33385/g.90391  ORF Transcript_33385/g.90391 Transcript_33385/m.90391 type:complete len:234 (-) Transcript_33385:462-1163(-)
MHFLTQRRMQPPRQPSMQRHRSATSRTLAQKGMSRTRLVHASLQFGWMPSKSPSGPQTRLAVPCMADFGGEQVNVSSAPSSNDSCSAAGVRAPEARRPGSLQTALTESTSASAFAASFTFASTSVLDGSISGWMAGARMLKCTVAEPDAKSAMRRDRLPCKSLAVATVSFFSTVMRPGSTPPSLAMRALRSASVFLAWAPLTVILPPTQPYSTKLRSLSFLAILSRWYGKYIV